jgi:hypothetical protein
MPVPLRDTAFCPHAKHLCAWFITDSTSAIRLRILRPYRGPKRPAERVFLPFLRAPFLTIRRTTKKIVSDLHRLAARKFYDPRDLFRRKRTSSAFLHSG